MKNDRGEKLVYTYVKSSMMKHVREFQREQAVAKLKELPIYALPKLIFDKTYQCPQVYGSLGHYPLINVGIEAFVAEDHAHELNAIITDLSVPELDDVAFQEVLGHPIKSDHVDHNEGEEFHSHDDDMDFTPEQEPKNVK